MARRRVDYLLIGGGLAAANCARWLREEGADGSILLVGREPDPPYNRPPLSKGYMQGKESREDVLFRPDEWWEEQDIELALRTSVMKLDPGERVATLSTRRRSSSARRSSRPARTFAGCAWTAATSTGSTTCGRSRTRTPFAPRPARRSGWC